MSCEVSLANVRCLRALLRRSRFFIEMCLVSGVPHRQVARIVLPTVELFASQWTYTEQHSNVKSLFAAL